MTDKHIAPPPEDVPCWRCDGTGRSKQWHGTADYGGPIYATCKVCGGTGVINGAPEIKRGPLPGPEVKR